MRIGSSLCRFYPRPRAGGDLYRIRLATNWIRFVSIRAPVRGGDVQPRVQPRAPLKKFLSRPRAGGDLDQGLDSSRPFQVSIRAPVRGATELERLSDFALGRFLSAPPCGGRTVSQVGQQVVDTLFLSAPPCGGRTCYQKKRTRLATRSKVSIRAPVRGATAGYLSAHDNDGL